MSSASIAVRVVTETHHVLNLLLKRLPHNPTRHQFHQITAIGLCSPATFKQLFQAPGGLFRCRCRQTFKPKDATLFEITASLGLHRGRVLRIADNLQIKFFPTANSEL